MGNLKYYYFIDKWPIYRKVDGKYYWLHDDGKWIHENLDSYFVSPKELSSSDMRKRISQYREGTEAIRLIKRIIFYQEVLWE